MLIEGTTCVVEVKQGVTSQVTPNPLPSLSSKPPPQATPKQEVKAPVVYAKPNKNQKMEIYGQLLNVTDIESLYKTAFAEAKGLNPQSISGIISNMINFPNIYNDLRARVYLSVEIFCSKLEEG